MRNELASRAIAIAILTVPAAWHMEADIQRRALAIAANPQAYIEHQKLLAGHSHAASLYVVTLLLALGCLAAMEGVAWAIRRAWPRPTDGYSDQEFGRKPR